MISRNYKKSIVVNPQLGLDSIATAVWTALDGAVNADAIKAVVGALIGMERSYLMVTGEPKLGEFIRDNAEDFIPVKGPNPESYEFIADCRWGGLTYEVSRATANKGDIFKGKIWKVTMVEGGSDVVAKD